MATDDDDLRELFDEPDTDERPLHDDRPVLLIDQTEDAFGAGGDIDAGETGDELLGEAGEGAWGGDDGGPTLGTPSSDTVADRVPLSAEEAAVHVVDVESDVDDLAT